MKPAFRVWAMKILIIEDEKLIQKSLERYLSSRGAEVESTHLGNYGIKLIRSNFYDKIICDIMLSDITGFEIIESLKRDQIWEEVSKKFVLMTAYCSGKVLERARHYDIPLLKKPFVNFGQTISDLMS